PQVAVHRSAWNSFSLVGFCTKLFDPTESQRVVPVWRSGTFATVCSLVSIAAISFALALGVICSHRRAHQALGFGVAIVAMLLVSPLTWDYSLLLLLLPLALIWVRLPIEGLRIEKTVFLICIAGIWISPYGFYTLFIPDGRMQGVASPFQA